MINPDILFGRLGNRLFQLSFIYAQMKDGYIPDIFVQDPKYFDHYREEIKQLFRPERNQIDMVAVHVRRGDNPINPDEPKYCENPFYVNLFETGYYENAMAEFPNADFIVFSDDIPWCKKEPLFAGCEFSEGKTPLEDMELMASCKGIIIANSTFGWWSAYLSDAKVIAPQSWYRDTIERTVCPDEWERL